MRRIQALVLATLFVIAAPLFAAPEVWTIDKNHSEATFTVKHLMSRVSGRFDQFDAEIVVDRENPAGSSVEFTIQTASINTFNESRDKHLRSGDFFDAEKNPTITFKSTSIAPSKTKDLYHVTGDLTMRGITRRIVLPVRFLGFAKDPRGNEKAGFEIETTVNRKDYEINWNRALDQGGFVLGDEVKVSINLQVKKKA